MNETTTTLNGTLNEFYDDVQSVVSVAFNGTVLEAPAREFVRCLIGSKIDAFAQALTFLNENLKVDMPRVNQSVLVLSPGQVDEATRPIALAALGSGDGGDGERRGLVARLVDAYVDGLKQERVVFALFMALWAVVVLVALAVILWKSCGGRCVRALGRRKGRLSTTASGVVVVAVPYQVTTVTEKDGVVDLPDLTPLPSPKRDEYEDEDGGPLPKKKKKLMALGVEKWVGEKEGGGSSWVARLRSIGHGHGHGHGQGNDRPNLRNIGHGLGGKDRPNLRIIIHPTELTGDPESSPREKPPTSAWSVSPPATTGTRRLPWTNPPKNGSAPTPARHMVSVPSSVHSQYDDAPVPVRLTKPSFSSTYALPLHLGFRDSDASSARPPERSTSTHTLLAPPPDRHRRTDATMTMTTTMTASVTPVTRLLTTTHARRSSSIHLNPFSTPFDDEHRAPAAL